MERLIDRIEEINQAEITFADIRKKYGTGRAFTVRNSQGDKKTRYRNGCMTEIGDIEESVWQQVVRNLIIRENETELFRNLKRWAKDTRMPFRDDKELENYALELHAARIFDCPEWVGYVEFNEKYRPEILHKK